MIRPSEKKKLLSQPGVKMRLCLGGCEQMFLSLSSAHRRCPKCAKRREYGTPKQCAGKQSRVSRNTPGSNS